MNKLTEEFMNIGYSYKESIKLAKIAENDEYSKSMSPETYVKYVKEYRYYHKYPWLLFEKCTGYKVSWFSKLTWWIQYKYYDIQDFIKK